MSIVDRGLGFVRSLLLKGLGGPVEPDLTDNAYSEDSIIIESNIKQKIFFYPATGIYSDNMNVTGWRYSRSIPQDLNDIYRRIENSLGGYQYNLEEGSVRSSWKGAALEGISLNEIKKKYSGTYTSKWLPQITTGTYSIYWLEKTLYSDYSSAKLLEKTYVLGTEEDEDGNDVNVQVLDYNFQLPYGASNVNITSFKRDKYFVNIPYMKYSYVDTNFGEFDYCYKLTDDEENDFTNLKVNTFFTKQVGLIKDSFDYDINNELIEHFEFVGIGSENRSIIFSEYFPIVDVDLIEETLSPDGSSTIAYWDRVSEFSFTGQKEFIVDSFNGKILINKTLEKDFYLFGYYPAENRLQFYEDLSSWPLDSGKIVVNGTVITYKERTKDSIFIEELLDIAVFVQGTKVRFLQQGANFTTGSNLWIGYKAIPRIDYEFDSSTRMTTSDVKPYRKIDSNGILEINPYERHISRLELKSNLSKGNDNVYKSLYMGGAATKITATAYNTHNTPVKESLVTFYCDLGKFNSEGGAAVATTNQNGEAYTYYSWPYSEESNHVLIETITHEDGDTLITLGANSIGSGNSEANIFQIAKDDPFYGSLGWESEISSLSDEDDKYIYINLENNLPNLEEYFTNQMLYLEYDALSSRGDFDDFVSNHNCQDLLINYCLGFIKNEGRVWKIIVDKIIDKNTIALKRAYMNDGDFPFSLPGAQIQLYKRNETVFDPEKVRKGFSYDRVMYVDGGEPALRPIRPAIEVNPDGTVTIRYSNILLPKPSMTDPTNLVAGYKIFLSRIARIWAEVIDPATGRTIQSNTIKVLVTLPDYLKGNSGFKIMTTSDNLESGLGGSNFLTVNEIEAQYIFNQEVANNPALVTVNPFYKNRINFFVENEE